MARTPTDPTKAQVWVTKGIDDLDFEFYFPQGPKGDPGGITMGTDLADTSLNNYVTSGVYKQTNPGYVTLANNYPIAGSGGILVVHQRDASSSVVIQTYQMTSGAIDARAFWQRVRVSGTWSPWRSFSSTRVDQTAGRVIYQWDDVNSREQIIYGDTGRRDITASFPAPSAGKVYLSRNGNYANLIFADYQDASTATSLAVPAATIPAGFRPQNWLYQPAASSRLLVIKADGGLTMSPHSSTVWQGGFTWRTEDPWPASLPGLAVGSTPNI